MTESDLEWIAERAAIAEFDAGMKRSVADAWARVQWQAWRVQCKTQS